jgi:hypothetical protein
MNRLVSVGIALGLLVGLVVVAEALARDRVISPDRSARNLSAFGQGLVWSREAADGRARLVLRSFGQPADVNAPSFAGGLPDPDLGQDAGGSTVVVYTRCGGTSGRNCDVYQFDFARQRESKVSGASTSSCSEFAPSIWEGTIAFGRSGSKRCRGLYVKAGRGSALRLDRRIPADTDIRSGRVAYQYAPDAGHTYIRIFTIRRGRSNLVVAGVRGRGELTRVTTPTFSGSHLYWLHEDERREEYVVGRSRGHADSTIQFSNRTLPGQVDSIALDGRTLYYTNGRGVHQANDPAPRFRAAG